MRNTETDVAHECGPARHNAPDISAVVSGILA